MKMIGMAVWALALAGRTAAQDWPEYCGSPCKNLVAHASNLPESFVPGERDSMRGTIILSTATNVLWGVRTSSLTYPSPTVAGGKIFTGGLESGLGVFKCLDARDGTLLWEYAAPFRKFPGEIDKGFKYMLGRITPNLGICATATYDDGRLYFVNHRCEVLCLDANGGTEAFVKPEPSPTAARKTAETAPPLAPAAGVRGAKTVWTFDLWDYGIRPADAANGSPLLDGDFLYINTSNGTDRDAQADYYDDRKAPAPDAPNLIVLDKKSGRLLATDDEKRIGPNLMHGQWSTPSLGVVNGKKLIFFGAGDGCCYAFEALTAAPDKPVKLKTVWWCDCIPPEYRVKRDDLNWAALYSLGDKRLKRSLNKQNESSYVGASEIIGCPVFLNNRVYVAIGRDPEHGHGRGALWCLDATKSGGAGAGGEITQSGKIWCYQGLDRTLATPAIQDGLLYISDVAGRIHCLEAETGKPVWVHETGADAWSSTLLADGKLFFPTLKHLWVLAAGREKKVLSKISLGAAMYATPVAVDNTLYINSRNYLWAVRK
ncbi:MAG TPA: PQQ-binding-like beta-propeller repeat protein [Planctomycetota bacterium]|nr:PQQ-binding-like beta-propeller repeat protein [Planctomycetota bacterium]